MKVKTVSLAVMISMIAACSQREADNGADKAKQAVRDGVNSMESADSKAHLVQADIRIIAPEPAPEGKMALYQKLGSDAVSLVTPMSTQGPAVALIGSGEHDMALTQDGCKFTVAVTVKNEQGATLEPKVLSLSKAGPQIVMLPGSDLAERRVEIAMDAAAEDNYFCNVMLRKKG